MAEKMPGRIWVYADEGAFDAGEWDTDPAGTPFIRADLVDDAVKALEGVRDYLTALEGNLIANDADMMIDDCDPPSAIADRLTAALTRIKGDGK